MRDAMIIRKARLADSAIKFNYTGSYDFTYDSVSRYYEISLLTSGVFTVLENPLLVDVFLVGGGGGGGYNMGGGGGGGYTATARGLTLDTESTYEVIIGEGGNGGRGTADDGSTGGTTTAFGYEAAGGEGGCSSASKVNPYFGGNGGSGGGGGNANESYPMALGGCNGSDGCGPLRWAQGGEGQDSPTRAFGELKGRLFAGGGGGSGPKGATDGIGGAGGGGNGGDSATAGSPNTGGGGGGGAIGSAGMNGGSGIAIIRIRSIAQDTPDQLYLFGSQVGGLDPISISGGFEVAYSQDANVTFSENLIHIESQSASSHVTLRTKYPVDIANYNAMLAHFVSYDPSDSGKMAAYVNPYATPSGDEAYYLYYDLATLYPLTSPQEDSSVYMKFFNLTITSGEASISEFSPTDTMNYILLYIRGASAVISNLSLLSDQNGKGEDFVVD